VTYRTHGHEPSDREIASLGYKAFGPRRPPFVPTAEQFQRAAEDLATGDDEELAETAATVAGWWPQQVMFWPWGYLNDIADD
jgi:hypothetical protein